MHSSKPVLLPLVVALPFAVTAAELPAQTSAPAAEVHQTETVVVTASAALVKEANQTTFTHEDIQREMIRDARDLARYDPDLGITDAGRFQKGFSLRGVEGNRVAITIDGISLPEFEENSLYTRYGNFNNSRQYIDPEIVRSISVTRNADSLKAGSGALAGGVSYQTLEASDLVEEGETFGALARVGFASKNKEWVKTAGLAWETPQLSALLMYSHRYGHEMDSTGEGPEYWGKESQHVDPSTHRHNAYLAKFRYRFTPEHSVGLNLNGQVNDNDIEERSYQLIDWWRTAVDSNDRHNATLDYTWSPYGDIVNKVVVSATAMLAKTAALNYKGNDNSAMRELQQQGIEEGWWTGPVDPYERTLQEIYDRRFTTRYARLGVDFESASLQFFGEHNIEASLFTSIKDFENENFDTIGIPDPWVTTYHTTIQYPVRTTQIAGTVNDHLYWYPALLKDTSATVGLHLGARFDWSQMKPRELNAPGIAAGASGKPVKTTFDNYAVNVGIDLELAQTWKAGYLFTTGFRNPTASEMYFTYKNPYGNWLANPSLDSETSFNHTVFLTGSGRYGSLDVSVYQIDYRDFLMESEFYKTLPGDTRQSYCLMMKNWDKAKIKGLEAQAKLNIGAILPTMNGWSVMGLIGMSEGETEEGVSMMAIQPKKMIAGIDYESPDGRWGLYSRVTHHDEKKAGDAQIIVPEDASHTQTFKYLSGSVTLVDLFGWWTPAKNVTLRAGVYNLTDEKYHTWDSLRGIQEHTTTNNVDPEGRGLQRFYAPGRNVSVAMELRF